MAASVETLSFPLLEVENLSKRFGDSAALTSISSSVREKEIVGVIGPNGPGKTTLLDRVAGLLHPDSGTAKTSSAPGASGKNTCFTCLMGFCLRGNSPCARFWSSMAMSLPLRLHACRKSFRSYRWEKSW